MMEQVVGFVVLVSGTSLYNELIRSCLPTMFESTVDSDLEVRCLDASHVLLWADYESLLLTHQVEAGRRPECRSN